MMYNTSLYKMYTSYNVSCATLYTVLSMYTDTLYDMYTIYGVSAYRYVYEHDYIHCLGWL